jgi:MerR family mercuric resistance operon transcriptional regulator
MAQELTIGKIAKLAGVNVETIRYYQRRGLLSEPEKLIWDTAAIQRTS